MTVARSRSPAGARGAGCRSDPVTGAGRTIKTSTSKEETLDMLNRTRLGAVAAMAAGIISCLAAPVRAQGGQTPVGAEELSQRLDAVGTQLAQTRSDSTDLMRRVAEIRARRAAEAGGQPAAAALPPPAPAAEAYTAPAAPPPAPERRAVAYGTRAALPPRGVMHPGRVRVGVLPFENRIPQIPGNFVDNLEAMVISEGLSHTEWTMLDRVITADVLQEQKFARSGLVRRGTGPGSTRNLGAQVLIKGAVTELTAQSSGGGFGIGFRGFSVGSGGSKATLGMDIRIVDAATGEVLAAGHKSTKIKSSDLAVGIAPRGGPAFSFSNFKNSPAGEAARRLVGQILEMLADAVKRVRIETPHQAAWSGLVAKVQGTTVYVNGGREQDLQPGMTLKVYSQADAVIDPATGENLGAARNLRATLVISDAQDRFSTCNVVSGGSVSVGDIVEQ
jgi:curli biogenesis system outer membrane secretion channel CsgG